MDISAKTTHRSPAGTREEAEHRSPSGMRVESAVSCSLILLGRLFSERSETAAVGKDAEKTDPRAPADGKASGCSHCGEQHGAFSDFSDYN